MQKQLSRFVTVVTSTIVCIPLDALFESIFARTCFTLNDSRSFHDNDAIGEEKAESSDQRTKTFTAPSIECVETRRHKG